MRAKDAEFEDLVIPFDTKGRVWCYDQDVLAMLRSERNSWIEDLSESRRIGSTASESWMQGGIAALDRAIGRLEK